jgi:hypothetical protein
MAAAEANEMCVSQTELPAGTDQCSYCDYGYAPYEEEKDTYPSEQDMIMQFFNEIDSNADGEITEEEWNAYEQK